MDHVIESNKAGSGNDNAAENAAAKLAQEGISNRLPSNLALSKSELLADTPVPESALGRYGSMTLNGIEYIPRGLLYAGGDAVLTHPLKTLGIIGSSAAMGVMLKTVLPDAGPAGKLAGLAIGAYFSYEAAQPIVQAYKLAGQAKTMADLDVASAHLGDAAGAFMVNSAIAGVGYNIGAAGASRVLARPEMAGFNTAKQVAWDKLGDGLAHLGENMVRSTGLIADPTALAPKLNTPAFESLSLSANSQFTQPASFSPEAPYKVTVSLGESNYKPGELVDSTALPYRPSASSTTDINLAARLETVNSPEAISTAPRAGDISLGNAQIKTQAPTMGSIDLPQVSEPLSSAGTAPPERFEWSKSTSVTDFDSQNFRFEPVRKFAQQVAENKGATLHFTDKIDAPQLVVNQKGAAFLSIPKNASAEVMSESVTAASYARLIDDDPILGDAARASAKGQPIGFLAKVGDSASRDPMQAAFDGARAYIRGDLKNFNDFSHALTERFGEVTADDRFVLHDMLNNGDSVASVWNRNVGPADLVSSGVPIGAETRGAMLNDTIAAMNPARRKDAIFAALSYTYEQAKALHGNESKAAFDLAHGAMARALSGDEVNNALSMYQISGKTDLASSVAPQAMQFSADLASKSGKDFATAYNALTATAPLMARRMGFVNDIANIHSLADLSEAIMPASGSSRGEAMQSILSLASDNLATMENHRIPMQTIMNDGVRSEVFAALSHLAPGGVESTQGSRALNVIARNLSTVGAPHTAVTMEAMYSYENNGGNAGALSPAQIALATRAYSDLGAQGVNPQVIEVALNQGYNTSDATIPWSNLQKTALPYQTGQVTDYSMAGVVGKLVENQIPVSRQNIALAAESLSQNAGLLDGDQLRAVLRVNEAVKNPASAPVVLETFARAQASANGINHNNMTLGNVFDKLDEVTPGNNSAAKLAQDIVQLSRQGGGFSDHQLQDPATVQMLVEQGNQSPFAPQAINVATRLVGSTETMNHPEYIHVLEEFLDNGGKMRDMDSGSLKTAVSLAEARSIGLGGGVSAADWHSVKVTPTMLKFIQRDPSYSISDSKLSDALVAKILQTANRS